MVDLYSHCQSSKVPKIYGLGWKLVVREPCQAGQLVATGYSCRCQAALVDGVDLRHPIQILLECVKPPP